MSRSKQPPNTTPGQAAPVVQTQQPAKRKRGSSSNAPTPAGTSVATPPAVHTPTPGTQPGEVATVQPPPSLKASRPLPTEAPPAKRRRTIPTHVEPWAPVDIVERMFSRFAESRSGILLDGKRFYDFTQAAHPSVSAWPPQLFADFITYYAANARPRRRGTQRVDSKSLFRFSQAVRRCYSRRHGRALTKDAANAATEARHAADKLTAPRDARPTLTMAEMLRLASAVWSPAYRATFRRRLDVALYMSLVLATGVPSTVIFPHAVPGKGYDDGPVYGLSDAMDGARWSDFEIWMTRYGPAAQFTCRADGERRYTLNDGNSLGMAASRLMAITMCFDELYGPGCNLAYLLSSVFWSVDGHDARIVAFDQERAEKHLFRLDDERQTPMMREDMNFELARLAEAAGIEHEVTTGMFRRLVAHKVFEQHGLEIASAILNHNQLAKTQRYLERKLGRTVTPAEQELGRGMDTVHKDLWLTLDHELRVKAIQKMPDYVTPHTWNGDGDRTPSPPLCAIEDTDLDQRAGTHPQRPGSPATPTPFGGQPRHCLVATPSDLRSEPTSPANAQAGFGHELLPPADIATATTTQEMSAPPKVAVHHQQLFGQSSGATQGSPYTQQAFGVGGQTGVSAHVAMYGQFPKISDIRGFAPAVPAMPVVSHPGFQLPDGPHQAQQPVYTYRSQNAQCGMQWGPSQAQQSTTTFHRTTQHPGDVIYLPKNKSHSLSGLPTPDDTPPDTVLMSLPAVGPPAKQVALAPAMERIDSAPLPQVDVFGDNSQTATAFNPGLGLIFEEYADRQSAASAPTTQNTPAGHQDARPRLQPQLRESKPLAALPALRPRPPPIQTRVPHKDMTYQERVLDEVARWMAGPAQAFQNGVNLVYMMIACDARLPRNVRYDPRDCDEEDVDTDEE